MTLDLETPAHRALVSELLFQLADDDLVVAERAAEWLGLAPHLEEDVAFASIAQDEMGHAAMYYGLLEQLGAGTRDDLAHLRPAGERRNSVLAERPNGPGTYLVEPHFDWAYAIARHFLYDAFERVRLDHLVESAYDPLAAAAVKIRREERYHEAHHRMWLTELTRHGAEVQSRLADALHRAAQDAGDLGFSAPWAKAWEELGILPGAHQLHSEWLGRVESQLADVGLSTPPVAMSLNGRIGQHSEALAALLAQVSDVYRMDPAAQW